MKKGRPTKENKTEVKTFILRASPQEMEQIKIDAEKKRQSINSYILSKLLGGK